VAGPRDARVRLRDLPFLMQLNFKEIGQGNDTPLIMLHGLFGSSDNWLHVAPKLGGKCYALDLRNHGHSPHSNEMGYALMAGDVAEFLDAQKLDAANVLGHSMGGKVAMQFAHAHPARVRKLIIVDIAPRPYPPEHRPIFEALLAIDLKQFHSRREIEDALAPGIPDLTLRRFLLKNLAHEPQDARAFKWRIPLRTIFANYPKLCAPIEPQTPFPGPALFLHGGQSPYVSDADVPQIRQLFPQAKIETIPRARHWIHADAPDEFVWHVSTFLNR
jgi:pimeloyl-ACP methyl ester carboxylesterase